MTERLYYIDASLLTFDAVAISHAGNPLHVILDRTAFYPTSGGQPHDTGTLGHAHVIDVVDADDHVVHVLDAAIPLGSVRGMVNPLRRRDYTEQHTAQHLLSALAADRLGWTTASVHFGPQHSTIEFEVADATESQLASLEEWAATEIATARAVTVGFEDAAAAATLGLRKPPPRDGEIRVITITGLDRSACGGTHVANSAALGMIWITDVETVRDHARVSFLAGGRARAFARSRHALLRTLANQLSCAVDELPVLVPKRQAELLAARGRVDELERVLAQEKLEFLVAASVPDKTGLRRVVYRAQRETASMLRSMAQGAGTMDRVLFVGTMHPPPSVYVGASENSGVDAGAVLKPALIDVGGRGGGSPRVAQGTAPDPARLRDIVNAIAGQ